MRGGSMGKRSSAALAAALIVLAGCGTKRTATIQDVPGVAGTLTAQQAGDTAYRYAFSGQVLNAATGDAIKNFAVSLTGGDTAVNTVINALGDSNGMFHISRTPSSADSAIKTVTALITAPGFQPVVQSLDVGGDCTTASCAGQKPVSLLLNALGGLTGSATDATATGDATAAAPAVQSLLPAAISALTSQKGTGALFNSLVSNGKLDTTLQTALAGSKNGSLLSNVMVLLNGGTSQGQAASLVTSLLGSVGSGKLGGLQGSNLSGLASTLIPLLASSNPQIGGAMLAANTLLPYLQPLLGQLGGGQAGPLGNILGTLLAGGNAQGNLLNLASLLQGGTGTGGAQLAMGSLLPLVQGVLGGKTGGTQNAFQGILGKLLGNSSLLGQVTGATGTGTGTASGATALLTTYLQPLIQGFTGNNASQIATLFNSVVKQGGVSGLANFTQLFGSNDKFAALTPFVTQLVQGLNSQDATSLASALQPLLSQKNPASAIRALLTKAGSSGDAAGLTQTLTSLFPSAGSVLTQNVPAKQVLAAQLIQGLVNGDLSGVQVQQDLTASPAVVVSGQAKDILKLAALPNVLKLISVGGKN